MRFLQIDYENLKNKIESGEEKFSLEIKEMKHFSTFSLGIWILPWKMKTAKKFERKSTLIFSFMFGHV